MYETSFESTGDDSLLLCNVNSTIAKRQDFCFVTTANATLKLLADKKSKLPQLLIRIFDNSIGIQTDVVQLEAGTTTEQKVKMVVGDTDKVLNKRQEQGETNLLVFFEQDSLYTKRIRIVDDHAIIVVANRGRYEDLENLIFLIVCSLKLPHNGLEN